MLQAVALPSLILTTIFNSDSVNGRDEAMVMTPPLLLRRVKKQDDLVAVTRTN